MLKKHDLGITPYIENISSRDQSLVRMGTSRVYVTFVPSNVKTTGCPIGSNLFLSWSKFFRKIDSGHQLGNFQVIDVNSFVRYASNRFREAYLWIFVKCIKLAANYLHLHSFPSPRLPQISPTTLQMIYRDTTEE